MLETIISDIYAAAAGRKDWAVALDALAKHLDLWAVQVVGADKHKGAMLFSFEGGPFPPATSLDYLRHYHHINPRLGPSMALSADAWFHDHQHFDEDFVAQDLFYQDFLIPYGGRYCSITKVVDREDVAVALSGMRGVGKSPLTTEEIEVLARVKFHLEQAMENYLHLRATYAEAGIGKQLLNEFRYPMVLVDDSSGIWFRNHAAEAALARADYIYESGDSLRCRNLEDGNELLVAIRSLNLQSADGTVDSPRDRAFVRLRKACDAYPVAAFVIAVRPQTVLGAFGHAPLALLIFHDPNVESELDPFIVAETFGLTPAESRIAVSLVKGLSAKEMAHQIGVSPTTVKSQLQSIYAKTGTNRQSDLCLLLTRTLDLTAGDIGVNRL